MPALQAAATVRRRRVEKKGERAYFMEPIDSWMVFACLGPLAGWAIYWL